MTDRGRAEPFAPYNPAPQILSMFMQAPGDASKSVYISSQEQENLVLPEGTSALQLLLRAVYQHQLLHCPIIAKEKVFDGPGPPEL